MNLLGKAQDKEFWKYVREADCFKDQLEKLKKAYDANMATGDLLTLKYREFKLFWTTGNRTVYEKQFGIRRERANLCTILSLVYPEEQRYLDDLMDALFAICDEYSWCLPAHHGKLEVNDNARIDLTGATTAAQLAEIYTVLEDRLEPLIKNRIKAEIDRRIVATFCPVERYWWERGTMNWTSVCVGSVGQALMLMRPDIVDDKFIDRLNASMDSFLTGFDNMGICYEGAAYWEYGFGHFVTYAEMVRRYTDGRVDYFKQEKVKNVSTFFQKMFLAGDMGVSFSDGGKQLRYNVYLQHFLKSEYPDDVLVYKTEFGRWGCTGIRDYTWYCDEYHKNPATDGEAFELYAPEAQWMVKKTGSYGFAAKGGCNNEFHNHNDVGSFIFAKGCDHVFTDPGGGVYTRQYFAEDTRYTLVECSSRGHSVPIIGGKNEKFGREFAATDVKYENGVFSMDIAGAYALDELKSLKRVFTLKEDTVTVTDEFDYTGNGELIDRVVTTLEPKLGDGTVTAGIGELVYDPSECEVALSSEKTSRGATVWFIDLKLKDGVNKITYRLR